MLNLAREAREALSNVELILLGYRGSQAHGTSLPPDDPMATDDIDVMGIAFGPIEHYFGLQHYEQTERWIEPYDIVVYELRKFFGLLLKSNPNVMSLLWLDKYLYRTTEGDEIIAKRDIFSSRVAYHSFVGYAHSQLKRMTQGAYRGYMGQKRKILCDRFGYDVKNAQHLIRLLKMGGEFLRDGKLRVDRTGIDAQMLIDIKHGKYTLAEVLEIADDLFNDIKTARDASCLPEAPDSKAAEDLLVALLMEKKTWRSIYS